jgi:hypothetical protein
MKLSAPLYSFTARGRVTPALTFSQRTSGAQVRFQRNQKDYLNAGRTGARAIYQAGVAFWNVLEQDIKDLLTIANYGNHFSCYNYFVQQYILGLILGPDTAYYGNHNYSLFIFGKQ